MSPRSQVYVLTGAAVAAVTLSIFGAIDMTDPAMTPLQIPSTVYVTPPEFVVETTVDPDTPMSADAGTRPADGPVVSATTPEVSP